MKAGVQRMGSTVPCVAQSSIGRTAFLPSQVPQVARRHRANAAVRSAKLAARASANGSASTAAADAAARAAACKKLNFPFVKLVGQDELKLALCLCVVDPNIGGVLIMGDRGTGKSVAVRSLIDLLPEIEVVENDPFQSSPEDPKMMGPDALLRYRQGEQLPRAKVPTPLVELPLGATEDRICGTIDIERALQEGIKAYEPGLLAKANRGILYVDEVNLLDDGLVDVVLDSAASGLNTVEREGVSIVHPAKFIMIGSGNPQEGEMRPQLLDRFGISVQVRTLMDVDQRVQLVLNRNAFEANPDAYMESAREEQEALKKKLLAARDRLTSVKIPRDIKLRISDACSQLNVDGLRGDLVTNRAARALVALEGRNEVTLADVERVIALCLNHRMRKDPLDTIDGGTKVMKVWNRVKDPRAFEEEERRRFEAEAKAKEEAAKNPPKKKAGAWGGLPAAGGPKK